MPKIIHVSTVHPTFDIRIYYKECLSLVEAGFDVHLLNANADNGRSREGVHLHSLSRGTGRIRRFLLTAPAALMFLVRTDADIYHLHDPELMPVGTLLRLLGRRVVFDMHENLPKAVLTKPWIPSPLRPLVSRLVKVMERVLLHRLPVVFAEQSYRSDYSFVKDSAIVQNFPRLETLQKLESRKEDTFTIGYIGGVTRLRGVPEVLEAMRILGDRNVPVRFQCVGAIEPTLEDELDDFVSAHGIDATFHGYLKPADGLEIIARCHVGVAVIHAIPNYVGSYPTKMFEYLALGLPVIVSDFPLYRSVVEPADCGLTVPPRDPQALADALLTLSASDDARNRMGRNGQALVMTSYSWASEFEKLLNMYRSIL